MFVNINLCKNLNQNGLKYFQYELEILHEHVAPVPLAIRRRNQQQRRPSSEDFLEAMEAKRNGIIRNHADHVILHKLKTKFNCFSSFGEVLKLSDAVNCFVEFVPQTFRTDLKATKCSSFSFNPWKYKSAVKLQTTGNYAVLIGLLTKMTEFLCIFTVLKRFFLYIPVWNEVERSLRSVRIRRTRSWTIRILVCIGSTRYGFAGHAGVAQEGNGSPMGNER